MYGQISETAVRESHRRRRKSCLREEDGFRQGRTSMKSYSSASRSLLLAGAFFGAFTFNAVAQQPAAAPGAGAAPAAAPPGAWPAPPPAPAPLPPGSPLIGRPDNKAAAKLAPVAPPPLASAP